MDPLTEFNLGKERLDNIRQDARRRHEGWHATHDDCRPPSLRRRVGSALVAFGHAVSGERRTASD